LGTHLRPKPRLRSVSRHGKPGSFPGSIPKLGLGNEKKTAGISLYVKMRIAAFFQILLTSLLFNIIFKIHIIIFDVCNLNFSQYSFSDSPRK
jgi:hypothetical protein